MTQTKSGIAVGEVVMCDICDGSYCSALYATTLMTYRGFHTDTVALYGVVDRGRIYRFYITG